MVTVSIGQAQMEMDAIDESWINHQLNGRRADGRSVCARVSVQSGDVNVALTTPQCAGNDGGGGRPPNSHEQRIIEEWSRHRLNTMDFTGGELITFLRALRRLV